jgi:two-component system cell cycle sensor histidine kinase/response regulator CckA
VAEALGGGTGAAELRRDHRIFELRVESAGDGVVGAALEVTERRKLADEELQARLQRAQKLELLGLLAGGIAHDFNNLLAGMLGHASLARMQLPPDHEAQPSLERVEACADRASDLTRQMLAYSGRGRFVVQPVDLSDAVQDMTGLMRVTQGKDVELDIQLDAALPPVEADVAQLRQLVMNLITNAADAIGDKPGRIRIRTSLLYCDPEFLERAYLREPLAVGTYVCLEVTDSGCGMDPSVVERMFDPFFTTKETGHGLGLAATLGIVRGHGGAIVVDSVPGQGTTIRVLLPPTDGKPVTTGRLLTLEDDLPRGAGTVLIVDDEDSVRTLAAAALRRAGWRTLQARDGLEALEKVGRHREKIRLVLLDMTMPRMDGPETWARLRDLAPGLPVLMSSGYAENEVRGRFEAGGPAGFLQKPYRAQELINAVADVLESRSAARE